jgi:hypothetical protein
LSTLIVAGMHRSGTSLTAQWLARCGVFEGDERALSAAVISNPRGQFEDEEFVRLHESILRDNGLSSSMVGGDAPLVVSAERERAARELIRARAAHPLWGFKDPRTTLFLGLWKRLLPDLRVLALYRPPAAVVDSLLRRRRARARRRRPVSLCSRDGVGWLLAWARVAVRRSWWNLALVRRQAEVWARYNAELLAFAAAHPRDLVLLRIDHLREHSTGLIRALNRRWGLDLRPVPIDASFEADLLRDAEETSRRGALLSRLSPRTAAVLRELDRLERECLRALDLAAG